MITGLDHVLLVCPSIDDGEAAYSTLLGRDPDWRSNDPGGAATVIFQLANTALEIMAPVGGGPLARRLHSLMDEDGPGLKSLIYGTDDINDARRVMDRRGLKPDEVAAGESIDESTGRVRSWSRMRLDDSATHGVRIFALQRKQPDPVQARPTTPGAVQELDHVVINTPNPDRAAALYGARLGLRLALDRSNPDWDMRLMFFRTGSLTVELAHRLSTGIGSQPDRLYGLSWRVGDIAAAHARLTEAKVAVSPVREGRRPGTRVFTVKDGTMNVPTLMIAANGV